jgi:hypothetical protein
MEAQSLRPDKPLLIVTGIFALAIQFVPWYSNIAPVSWLVQ